MMKKLNQEGVVGWTALLIAVLAVIGFFTVLSWLFSRLF